MKRTKWRAVFFALLIPVWGASAEVALPAVQLQFTGFVFRKTRVALERTGSGDPAIIYRAILNESRRHGFDPMLIMAIIEHESGFGIYKRGRHGEIGLMQLKPSTARWIAARAGVRFRRAQSLEDPVMNIRLGTAYLAYLRNRFPDQSSRHYLSAYNMGPGNARKLLRSGRGSSKYSVGVMRKYRRYHLELKGEERWV